MIHLISRPECCMKTNFQCSKEKCIHLNWFHKSGVKTLFLLDLKICDVLFSFLQHAEVGGWSRERKRKGKKRMT